MPGTPAPDAYITIIEPSTNHQLEPLPECALPLALDVTKKKTVSQGTRIPEPFFLTPEMRTWAAEKAPEIDLNELTVEFVDYWRGIPGARGKKCDWEGTWRNRVREKRDRKRMSNAPRKTRFDQATEKLKARISANQ